MKDTDTLVNWLNDAYAMEKGLIETLENHADDAKDHPDIRTRIQAHLQETKGHAEQVERCLEQLGEGTSALKTAVGKVTGFFQGVSSATAGDELVKNALGDYAAEHLEIASYRALIEGAEALGRTDVADTCRGILREEEAMAAWLEQNLPNLVREYLMEESRR